MQNYHELARMYQFVVRSISR